MKRIIYRRLKARKAQDFVWQIENAKWATKASITWSRSTRGSSLILDSGYPELLIPKVDLGTYNGTKEVEIELPKNLVFEYPTRITLTTPGAANVLIALECEFNDDDLALATNSQSIGDAKDNNVVLAEEFIAVPMLPVTIND